MSKSLYKLPFLSKEVILKSLKKKKDKTVFFYQRRTLVPFIFVNRVLGIHQGMRFKSYNFHKIQLGLKVGEFTLTRRKPNHTSKRQKVGKKKKKNIRFSGSVFQLKKKGFFH